MRAICFYLPQFHPIPENDKWWGKGFTDWTNVAKATPLFPGHYQPHIPADLGFYDLRLPETREAQAKLAREYGIYGFAYYHYWFNGKRLLGRPFNEVLASGKPDFPFCLCWANENWTRVWDGQDKGCLIVQNYSEEDDIQHIRWLINAFRDKRYIRIKGKPVFLVYRATKLPDPLKTTSIWREEARKMGVGEIFLCRVESFPDEHGDPTTIGFDAAVEFQPDWANIGSPLRKGNIWRLARALGLSNGVYENNKIFEYDSLIETMLQKSNPPYKRFPCVIPSWDNTARRKTGVVAFHNSTPDLYEKWLKAVIKKFKSNNIEEDFIFIKAWNEWGEGNHLEPCQKWGRKYLEATLKAFKR
jgi:lipopolysaccharide biosynthesis protein